MILGTYTTDAPKRNCNGHDDLRAALRLAGAEIRKLNFGRSDTPILKLLRRILRESRVVAKAQREGNGIKARL